MKLTTIEHEKEIRGRTENVTITDIAFKGSLIPQAINDENKEVVEVLFCETISGGADQVNNMPRTLILTKLKMIDGELFSTKASYVIDTNNKKP